MKREFYFLITGVLALFLTACGSASTVNETKPDCITEKNLEYYVYNNGSSSLFERFAIYEYNGEFIFAADYFNCGDELAETRLLSEEEKELFLEEVIAVSPKATKGNSDLRDGNYTENGCLVIDGIFYSVEMIDFKSMGIDIKDALDAEYPSMEDRGKYEIQRIPELQELEQWKKRVAFAESREFERSVGEQIEYLAEEEISQMVIDRFQDKDFIIKAESKKGNHYTVTVTYSGYVAEVEKE